MTATITIPLLGDMALDIPKYFTVFGFQVYYYAVCIVLGFGLAALYVLSRRELFKLTTDNVLDMLLIAIPCGIIGARIYYMLFNFDNYFSEGNYINIIRFRDGGLGVYGGIILAVSCIIIYARKKKLHFGNLLDAGAFGLFIGQAVGRWGNFINVEAYGIETELPWKMGVTAYGVTTYHHPTFLYESLWNISGFLIIHLFSKRFKTKYPGQYFLFYTAWYGAGRFMIEGLRIDSLYIWGTQLRVSQWLAFASFITALGLLIYMQYIRKDTIPAGDETVSDNDDTSDTDELSILDGTDEQDIGNEPDDTDELVILDGAAVPDINDENEED